MCVNLFCRRGRKGEEPEGGGDINSPTAYPHTFLLPVPSEPGPPTSIREGPRQMPPERRASPRGRRLLSRSAALAAAALAAAALATGPSAAYVPAAQPRRGGRRPAGPSPGPGPRPTSTALPCQLLGMNCRTPTDFSFSFRGFARRGGDTDVHSDGWGLAIYEGRGVRTFHDPSPAADSPIAAFVGAYPVKTYNMMAHIRFGTEGRTCLENVHPFQRELWGIQFVFAHNGDVPMFKRKREAGEAGDSGSEKGCRGGMADLPILGRAEDDSARTRVYNPVGGTDSEAIFCSLLNALRARFDALPSLPVLHDTLRTLCEEVVESDPEGTILNFLLGCGQHVQFAYSWPGKRPGSDVWNGLHYVVREAPFSTARLSDCDYEVDFSEVAREGDRVAVIATKPLTVDEDWIELGKGELVLFDEGEPHAEPAECFESELRGHGLKSDAIPRPSLEEDMERYDFFVGSGI